MMNIDVLSSSPSVSLLCMIQYSYIQSLSVVAQGCSIQLLMCCNFWMFNACLVRQKGHGRSAAR